SPPGEEPLARGPVEHERASMERDGSTSSDTAQSEEVESRIDGASPLEESWEGDGSVDIAPDDGEWGGEAPARNSGVSDGDETASAADLARANVSLQDHLHDQARCLRLSDEDRAALYFLIESLSDDGYLEESLADLAGAWLHLSAVATLVENDPAVQEEREALEQRLGVALQLLQ